jgi:P4 family phage/plasmid primase-like protien
VSHRREDAAEPQAPVIPTIRAEDGASVVGAANLSRDANGSPLVTMPASWGAATTPAHEKLRATVRSVDTEPTQKQRWPMVKLHWRAEGNGKRRHVEDAFVFFGDRRDKGTTRRLLALCAAVKIDIGLVPKHMREPADFDAFVSALRGKTALLSLKDDGRVHGYEPAEPEPAASTGKASKPPTLGLLDRVGREGHAKALALGEKASVLLGECAAPMPAEIRWTRFEGGKKCTRGGEPCSGPWQSLGDELVSYSRRTVAKGTGRWFMGATTGNGRCRDQDIKAVHVITLDCDGTGDWHRFRGVLDEARLGSIAQRSSNDTPEIPKWHASLAVAIPWAGGKPHWRLVWRWLVGFFAAVAGLKVDFDGKPPSYGFDHTTDRLGQPIFPAAKRFTSAEPPETVVVDGLALDIEEFLTRSGFNHAWFDEAVTWEPETTSAATLEPTSALLVLSFAEAGMLGPRVDRGDTHGFAVECPLEHQHTTGSRFDSSTVIFDPAAGQAKGHFHCSHRCGDMPPDGVLKLLPSEAVARAKARHAEAKRAAQVSTDASEVSVRIDAEGVTADRTDLRNAERLIEWFGADLRYCGPWKKWLGWDGTRWELDALGRAHQCAKETSRRLLAEALEHQRQASEVLAEATAGGEDAGIVQAKKAYSKAAAGVFHAIASQSAVRIEAMLALARSAPSVRLHPTALDTDPMTLNVTNGTIELSTGKVREHRREDLITKIAPVAFDQNATSPIWDAFLCRAMNNDSESIDFLQRLTGYGLTGDVREHVLAFFYGGGANGKSTFVGTIVDLLGDYATPAARKLLFRSKNDRHSTELATLHGRRFVTCSEIEDGLAIDEALLKDLTGGDRINARRMREDEWSFKPTHKLFLSGNHKPSVRGDDEGIWRRIRLVPWVVTIPESERDKGLPAKLRGEQSGILAWALRGCLEWHRRGLDPPSRVRDATADYRAESDLIGQFFEPHLAFVSDATVARSTLRERYELFCRENGCEPLGAKRFAARLRAKGVTETSVRVAGCGLSMSRVVDGWRGVTLKSDDERERSRGS